MHSITFFYVPCKDKEEVSRLSNLIIDNNLAACTNSFPMESTYFWNGNLENDHEHVLLAKTIDEKAPHLSDFLEKYHSYDTPCIACWQVSVNEKYYNWVLEQTESE